MKDALVSKILKEREINKMAKKIDRLIRDIVNKVEELNNVKGIPEVTCGKKYFGESHTVLSEIGYDPSYDIVKFRIPLNKVSKFRWFWNPNTELLHVYYLDCGDMYGNGCLEATPQMYEDLISKLESRIEAIEQEILLERKKNSY